MHPASRLVIAGVLAVLVATSLSPFIDSRSDNLCAGCHNNYSQYLDILEDDASKVLPVAISEDEVLAVTVVMKNKCNSPDYNVLTSISASLSSQNGHFRVLGNPVSIGSLGSGQTGKATWQITPVYGGIDTLQITAQGRNTHYNLVFTDAYSPPPPITVTKTAVNLPPSISLTSPTPGLRATGGSELSVGWSITDEDKAACKVDLYYSTDDFVEVNHALATGLPPDSPCTLPLPEIDSSTVKLKATVTDPGGLSTESVMSGTFSIDSTPPSVIAAQPAEGAKNVSGSAFIVVRFSEPVMTASAQTLFDITPDPGGMSWTWNDDGTEMTATHDTFEPKTSYTCTIASGVKDNSTPGNGNKDPYTWSFDTPAVLLSVPSISLSSPSKGDRYYWGDPVHVHWATSGGTGALAIDLSMSDNGTNGPFIPIGNGIPNDGVYSFKAPQLLSDTCMVEASVHDQNGKESRALSGDFSIARDLVLQATFPSGAASILANTTMDVTWNCTGGRRSVSAALYFQPDANSTAQVLATRLPRSGSYRWKAPELNIDGAMLLLNASDGWNRSVVKSSDALSIRTKDPPPPPPPKVNHPPVIMFEVREKHVTVKEVATLDASASFDNDGDRLYYLWDFGDGTGILNTTEPVITHFFVVPGDITVRLTSGDGRDETTQTTMVRVEKAHKTYAGAGSDLAAISLGILVVILGTAGTVYAIVSRPPEDMGHDSGDVSEASLIGHGPPARVFGRPPLVFNRELCIGCGACAKICAHKAISMVEARPTLEPSRCPGCGECEKRCARTAISFDLAFRDAKRGG